jgi:protein SCO1/2
MSRPQKILTIVLWSIAVAGMIGVVAIKALPPDSEPSTQPALVLADPVGAPDAPLPILYDAPPFALIDQDKQPATNTQLLGHPWVADFIFTTCASLCPTMSAHMTDLQSRLPTDVKLVSFSVDPTHDDPAALKAYAARYKAEPGRWIFLTGDEKTQERVVRGMKMYFAPSTIGSPIQHDEHFVLVDADGHIRRVYDSLVPADMDQLVRDANQLSQEATVAAARPDGDGK